MTTNTEGIHLWLVLWRATNAVAAHARRSYREPGSWRSSDFAVLEAVYHLGALPVSAIGRKVLLTSGSITPAVDRLERQGWSGASPIPEDRRVRVVHLTRTGRRLVQKSLPGHRRGHGGGDRGALVGGAGDADHLAQEIGHGAEATIHRKGKTS